MNDLAHKQANIKRRSHRVRSRVVGTSDRPRLSINISNFHVTAQIIDDSSNSSRAYATTVGQKISGTMTQKAAWVGSEISKKAKKAKITKVAFDRGSRKYHGRTKALADAAREGGLEF